MLRQQDKTLPRYGGIQSALKSVCGKERGRLNPGLTEHMLRQLPDFLILMKKHTGDIGNRLQREDRIPVSLLFYSPGGKRKRNRCGSAEIFRGQNLCVQLLADGSVLVGAAVGKYAVQLPLPEQRFQPGGVLFGEHQLCSGIPGAKGTGKRGEKTGGDVPRLSLIHI